MASDTASGVPAGPSGTGVRMRASDADRAATVRVLQDAVARGLLTPDEGSDRMAAAFAVVHLDQLGPIIADLPPATPTHSGQGRRYASTLLVAELRSLLGAGDGRLRSAHVAVAFLVALLLVVTLGALAGELLFDGGGGRGGFDRD